MADTKIDKNLIYKQIDDFNNTPSNPDDKSSKSVAKSYLYMDKETAQDRAEFFKFALKDNNIHLNKPDIIDLTFGSGSFSAYLLLENNINIEKLILNDKDKLKINKDIGIGKITHDNILDKGNFTANHKYDLIIFNPQIGGNYPSGELGIETIEPIISERELNYSSMIIKKNENKKEIFLHSDILSKSKMNELLKNIKIHNYYDVFYQSKESNKEGKSTNIVKFRKTFDTISKTSTVTIFYGSMGHFNILFKDYSYLRYMVDDGADLFILSKELSESICYEKINNEFVVNEDCEKIKQNNTNANGNIKDIFKNLNEDMSEFKNIEQIWGESDNLEDDEHKLLEDNKKQEDKAVNNKKRANKPKKPFRNFLLDYIKDKK